ncbi:DapH/DapD/GlmU-related protein [Rhodococcus sp. IEGM 1379]|uniref:DapH/DapD/GlmU-related protein n=1 Tax=Rhodococcus sp. IEGM 1379 TaxID=3047086 RepID=UPI0024B81C9A|nr:DapH/DapD/GlmU-related protein [Rhodococcus sp. IEGM 1379]
MALHPNAVIGNRATIYHRVTIGGYSHDKMNVPTIGDDVYFGVGSTVLGRVKIGDGTRVGAGAILVGDITIGANARIGAGAVVDHDIPARL